MPIKVNQPGLLVPAPASSPIDLADGAFVQGVLAAGGVTMNAAQLAVLPSLITAASRMMIRFMGGRLFPTQTFNEIVTPYGMRQDRGEPAQAKLSYFPVTGVQWFATSRNTALLVQNNDQSTNQAATVQFNISGNYEFTADLLYTGLTLTRWASGTQHTDSITWTSTSPFTTVQAVATQINGLGGGWQANVQNAASGVSQTGLFPACRLAGVREPKNAFSPGAGLDLFIQPMCNGSDIDRAAGIMSLYYGNGTGTGFGWGGFGQGDPWGTGWDGSGGWGTGWGGGWNQVQVIYTAGWDTIPEDLQLACSEVVKFAFDRLNTDGTLKSETAKDYSYAVRDVWNMLPDWVINTLTTYRDWSV